MVWREFAAQLVNLLKQCKSVLFEFLPLSNNLLIPNLLFLQRYENNLSHNTDFYYSVFIHCVLVGGAPLVLSCCQQIFLACSGHYLLDHLIACYNGCWSVSEAYFFPPPLQREASTEPLISLFCCQPASSFFASSSWLLLWSLLWLLLLLFQLWSL